MIAAPFSKGNMPQHCEHQERSVVRIWLCEYNPYDRQRIQKFIAGMHEAKLNPYYAEDQATLDHIDWAIARAEKQLTRLDDRDAGKTDATDAQSLG